MDDLSKFPVVEVAAGHVDDFLFLGIEENKRWQAARKRLQDKYDWKEADLDALLYQCLDTV